MAILDRITYRRLTDDWASYDGEIDAAITEAQSEVERITNRKFELATYTDEVVTIHGTMVFPKAVPLVSVATPANSLIDGSGIDLGLHNYNFIIEPFSNAPDDRTTITYVGGYSAGAMPVEIKRIVARIVHAQLNPVQFANVPSGATRIRVGDVELEGRRLTSAEVVDDSIRSALRPWRRPDV